jgi:hypothetical protein
MLKSDINRHSHGQTLMNGGEKQHIMCCRLIGGAAPDHSGSSCKFALLNIAQSGLPETFRAASRAGGPKELMTSDEKPIRGSRPPLRVEVAVTVLPYKLNRDIGNGCCGAARNIP